MENTGLAKHDLVSVEAVSVDDGPSRRRRRSRWKAAAACATAISVLAMPALADADVGVVNAQRAAAGLPPVVEDGGLSSVAQQQAAQMAATGNLAHSSNLGGTVGTVLPAYAGAAENVGQGQSLASVSNLFMGSPTHRSAILGNYDTAGVGVATGRDGRVWVTQLFARTGGRVLSNTVTRPVAPRAAAPRARRSACRIKTRTVTRLVRGKRVARRVRAKVCTKAKRKVTRKRSARRAVRSSSRR
jgi:Cysteine-rich secretory protein family